MADDNSGPFTDFTSAAAALLSVLHEQLGVELTAVTRKSGDDWLALGACQRTGFYEIQPGTTWPWHDTFCARMVDGRGPRFAPDARKIAAYREPSYADMVGSYVGVPLRRSDGEVFGSLCAFDRETVDPELGHRMPLVSMTGRLLATLLEHDLIEEEHRRKLEQVELQALRDTFTGLWNRRAWERFMESEDARSRRHGHPICIISVTLDGLGPVITSGGQAAGDGLIKRAVVALSAGVRTGDVVARLANDRFGILAVHCGGPESAVVRGRLLGELKRYSVPGSVGLSMRGADGLQAAWSRAEEDGG